MKDNKRLKYLKTRDKIVFHKKRIQTKLMKIDQMKE